MKRNRMLYASAVLLVAVGAMAPAAGAISSSGAPKGDYQVTLKASTKEAIAQETDITLKGQVTPLPPKGSKVVVQVQRGSSDQWAKLGNARVKDNGGYKFVTTPTTRTDLQYRVMKPGDAVAGQDLSPVRAVKVMGWVYLTGMKTSAGENMLEGTLPVDGDVYAHTLYGDKTQATAFTEFTLGHKATTLDVTFGLSDRTETGGAASIQLTADQAVTYQRTFGLGSSEHLVLDVTDVYRIRLDFAQVPDTPQCEPAAAAARILTD